MPENRPLEISVVVPAYNEEKRLGETLPVLWKGLKRRFAEFEIIVVDDGSSDRTASVVEHFSRTHCGVRLVRYEENRGKGYAVRTGMLASKGSRVLFSDADLSTPIREIDKLLKSLREGFDVAIGSRARRESKIVEYQPFYRVLMGKTFNKIVRILAVRRISDTQCGFKCFTRQAAREIFRDCRVDGFGFDVEALFIAQMKGFTIKEVGVVWRNDPQSKVHPVKHSLQMLKEVLSIRFYAAAGCYGRRGVLRTTTET